MPIKPPPAETSKAQEELLDIKGAARFLQVSETSLRRWTRAGRLACLRVGLKKERRFRRSDLIAFMEDQPGLAGVARGGIGADDPQDMVGGIPLRAGTHLCGLYSSEEARARQAVGFLADGLRPDITCFLVATPEGQRQVLDRLIAGFPSVPAMIDSGALVLSGYFSTVAEQIGYWETNLLAALSRGARSLRVVGDVSAGKMVIGNVANDVREYEREYTRVISQRFPVVTLCQYDASLLTGTDISDLCRQHPHNFAYPVERLFD